MRIAKAGETIQLVTKLKRFGVVVGGLKGVCGGDTVLLARAAPRITQQA